jgi:predicted molibdopterin-dependent oxidoreductase YjgC
MTITEIQIDGRHCPAEEGERVLDVARRNGIFIPALCAHALLKPYGACRLCLVEIEQDRRTRTVAACAYPAQTGLVVRTATEKVRQLRRGIMELLLARCPDSPPVRALAERLGVKESRFPPLGRAGERCVLCGLCVRVCGEVIGSSAISFASRGLDRHVDSPFSLGSDNCVGCCACVAVCPTNAITARLGLNSLDLAPFQNSVKLALCVLCGTPVAPAPLLASVESRMPSSLAPERLCTECKAERRARALAAVAAQRSPAPAEVRLTT